MKYIVRHKWKFIIPIALIVILFLFRFTLLTWIGNFLVEVDEPQKSDVIYVLGGNSVDRSMKVKELYDNQFSNQIVCLGGNMNEVLEYYNIKETGAEVAYNILIQNKVPATSIRIISKGTSTIEEKEEILKDIESMKYNTVTLVTDKFHSRRVRNLFEEELEEMGVELNIVGSDNSKYDEELWWEKEEGLIMVNNEYMKSLYYFLKY